MEPVFVLLLIFAGSVSGAIEKRIVGGIDCKKDRQYHVAIKSSQGGQVCGGSLLNTRWVITAADCGKQKVEVKIGSNNDVSFFKRKPFFKDKELKQTIDTNQQFTYTDEDGKEHGIMLIRLNDDVSSKLPTIDLPPGECNKPGVGTSVKIGGWGYDKAGQRGKKFPKKLKCANTEVTQCDEDNDATMCAFKPGVDVCFGDTGSALEYDNKLHGIILNKPVDKCEEKVQIANICFYREWITKTMSSTNN